MYTVISDSSLAIDHALFLFSVRKKTKIVFINFRKAIKKLKIQFALKREHVNFLDFSQSGQFFVISIEYENSNSIVEQFPLVRFHSSIFIFTFVNFFFFNQIESQTHILLETGIRPLNWLTQNYSSTGLNRILSCQIRIHIQICISIANKQINGMKLKWKQ